MARKKTGQLYFKNGQWYGRWHAHVDGEEVRIARALGTANKAVARIKLDRLIAEGAAALTKPAQIETLQQAAERVLNARIATYYTERPWVRPSKGPREDLSQLTRFAFPVIGAMPIDAISGSDINTVLDAVKAAGLSKQTCAHMRERLSSLYRQLKREGSVKANPVLDCTMPDYPRVPRRERAVLNDLELITYLSWQHPIERFRAGARVRQVMACLSRMFGGVRTGDMHALRWEDFDVPGFAWGYAPRQKTAQPQLLEVPTFLRRILADHWQRAGRPTTGLLFPIQQGARAGAQRRSFSHAAAFRRDLQLAFKEALAEGHEAPRPGTARWAQLFDDKQPRTLPVDFHSWRRAFVQGLADAQVNAQQAAALAGHASLSAHQLYLRNSSKARQIPEAALPSIGHRVLALAPEPGDATESAARVLRDNTGESDSGANAGPKRVGFAHRPLQLTPAARSQRNWMLLGWQKAPRVPVGYAARIGVGGYAAIVFGPPAALQALRSLQALHATTGGVQ